MECSHLDSQYVAGGSLVVSIKMKVSSVGFALDKRNESAHQEMKLINKGFLSKKCLHNYSLAAGIITCHTYCEFKPVGRILIKL